MKLAILATATDEAAESEHAEAARFADLKLALTERRARVDAAWGLLGKYDYLLLLDVAGGVENVFAAMSTIAQSGAMRTESFVAMPLERYFELAAGLARSSGTHDRADVESRRGEHA
jgi:uncharacterized protein with GYD domain